MRVIAGLYRSRLLQSPPGTLTRPTSDRLRETLFNILAPRIPGSRFVDLYAGTGAVGIEALSRGAAHVWFAENAAPALKVLRANLQSLGIKQSYALEDRGTGALLQRLLKLPEPIDILYLDPPYEADDEYAGTLAFLGSAQGIKLLAKNALVIAEHATKTKSPLARQYGRLTQTRTYKQGETTLTFYQTNRPRPDSGVGSHGLFVVSPQGICGLFLHLRLPILLSPLMAIRSRQLRLRCNNRA